MTYLVLSDNEIFNIWYMIRLRLQLKNNCLSKFVVFETKNNYAFFKFPYESKNWIYKR